MKEKQAKLLALLLPLLWQAAGCCGKWPFKDCPPVPHKAESECWRSGPSSEPLDCKQLDSEPNDTVPMAGTVTLRDCASTSLQGTLAGHDVDVFHARGDRCETGKPALHLGTAGIRACLFVQCATGSTGAVEDPETHQPTLCDDGKVAVHHPNGLLGCCRSEIGDVGLAVECSTDRKALDAFVIVDGNTDQCTAYDVSFHL